jgi:hypothetical protein
VDDGFTEEDGTMATIRIWESYVGRGAPSNASGSRVGYGWTRAQASEAAGHWNNQAPWERFRRVEISDGPVLTAKEERVTACILPDDVCAEFASRATRATLAECWRLARAGRGASAIELYWSTIPECAEVAS